MNTPKVFISYSWDTKEHKEWVKAIAERLRGDGADVTLDQWHLVPGDQLAEFMEKAVRESNYVLIVCTPRYKNRSDKRTGGVGYEGDIMTGEVLTEGNNRKFIPLLRIGKWPEAAPTWLSGKFYLDFRGNPYAEEKYEDLLNTVCGTRILPPPVSSYGVRRNQPVYEPNREEKTKDAKFEPVCITGLIIDEVGTPKSNGTPGSVLYEVPFRLSHRPPGQWIELFIQAWNHPSTYTSMHRPGIASVIGDKVILDGTTVEEIEKYHRSTLILAVEEANRRYQEIEAKQREALRREQEQQEEHKRKIEEATKRLSDLPWSKDDSRENS